MAPWTVSGTTQVSLYQKGKTNLDLLEQEIVSGSDIIWAICKSAPHPRQISMPASHHSVFTGQMPFLPLNQQHQSTEGHHNICHNICQSNNIMMCLAAETDIQMDKIL